MAGSITGTITRIQTQQGRPQMVELALTCTGDADNGAYPATVINDLANIIDFDLRGLRLYSTKAIPGDTPPTDGTSLTITDKFGVDLLAEAGVGFVPAAGSAWSINGVFPPFITGDLTVTIIGNSVNSAVFTLVLELIGT